MRRSGTGQGGKSFNDRMLAAEVRTLTLQEIKKGLKGGDKEFKQALLLRLAGSILPRLNEHAGPDGGNIPVAIYGGESIKTLPRYDSDKEGISINQTN